MPAKKWIVLGIIVVFVLLIAASLNESVSWEGVDTAVVGKYGSELGRAPWTPLINLQGDSLLFAFTIAGVIGGFVAGYYWRELFGNNGSGAVAAPEGPRDRSIQGATYLVGRRGRE
ncbi:MAG: cobalt ABC transporter permease [Chloroflexi bacterium]|nr:cobalt ABC transporter permease [Chloroflexota bacterium]MDA8188206.1 hypothetical protein [Dehalococcoidales bacterium]